MGSGNERVAGTNCEWGGGSESRTVPHLGHYTLTPVDVVDR